MPLRWWILLLLARLEDGSEQPVLVSLRGDQELNPVKLTNAVSHLTIRPC